MLTANLDAFTGLSILSYNIGLIYLKRADTVNRFIEENTKQQLNLVRLQVMPCDQVHKSVRVCFSFLDRI